MKIAKIPVALFAILSCSEQEILHAPFSYYENRYKKKIRNKIISIHQYPFWDEGAVHVPFDGVGNQYQ